MKMSEITETRGHLDFVEWQHHARWSNLTGTKHLHLVNCINHTEKHRR